MTDVMLSPDLGEAAARLRADAQPFAFATIVRTAGVTAAKPGAKALLAADGTILHGFLGGGCTKGAVRRAAVKAIAEGQPALVSVAPEDLLEAQGVAPGTERDGVQFARNGCPSGGTVDIFIEPCLPMPELTVMGASPVARALAELAPRLGWALRLSEAQASGPSAGGARLRAVVIATQGDGDRAALRAALDVQGAHVAFVGSRRKFAALSKALLAEGVPSEALARVQAPAGLAIGAVTPEEIALSILADLTRLRRQSITRGDDA